MIISYLRIGRTAEQLGVCIETIRCWDAKGLIKCIRTPGGHSRIPISEIKRLTYSKVDGELMKQNEIAVYCRVIKWSI